MSGPKKLEDQRKHLVKFVEFYRPQGSLKNSVIIVFDGKAGMDSRMQTTTVKVSFSQDESADDKIKNFVAKAHNKKNIIVVTDDRDIQYAIRALGAKRMGVKEFLSRKKPVLKKSRIKYEGAGQIENSKIISKSQEFEITSDLEKIWLKNKLNQKDS
jgi:predicted RNA-binding protein with PIN domain